MTKKQGTTTVDECCLVCVHGNIDAPGIVCDLADDAYSQKDYYGWCEQFEEDDNIEVKEVS